MVHAERVVLDEQIQNFYRQTYYSLDPQQRFEGQFGKSVSNKQSSEWIQDSDDDLKLFAQRQSREVPIERFATLDAANDPTGIMDRIEMRKMRIQPGQMDQKEKRRASAEVIARDTGPRRQEAEQPRELREPRRRRNTRHFRNP